MMLRPGAYRHFKYGTVYEVIFCAINTETEEELVIYKGPNGKTWARPLSSFLDKVSVEGKEVPRFEYLERDW